MEKIKSRKFLITVGIGLLTACNDAFALGLSADTIMQIVAMAATYVVGQGYVDGKEKEGSK